MNFRNLLASFAIAASLFTVPAGASAQTYDGKALDAAISRMKVAPNQEEQVRAIMTEGMIERLTILQEAGFERGKKPSIRQLMKVRKPINQSRTRTEMALAKILTKEQLATYQQIMKESQAKLRERYKK